MLICAKRSLYATFSVLPYGESAHLRYKESATTCRERLLLHFLFHHCPVWLMIIVRIILALYMLQVTCICFFLNSDTKLDAQRQRLSSVVIADLLPSLEGMELSAFGKVKHQHFNYVCVIQYLLLNQFFSSQTVSYAQFLYPTNALVRQKSMSMPENCIAQTPQSRYRSNGQKNFTPARLNNSVAQDTCMSQLLFWLMNTQSSLCVWHSVCVCRHRGCGRIWP